MRSTRGRLESKAHTVADAAVKKRDVVGLRCQNWCSLSCLEVKPSATTEAIALRAMLHALYESLPIHPVTSTPIPRDVQYTTQLVAFNVGCSFRRGPPSRPI